MDKRFQCTYANGFFSPLPLSFLPLFYSLPISPFLIDNLSLFLPPSPSLSLSHTHTHAHMHSHRCPSALEQNDPVSAFDEKGNLHSVWMDQWNLGYGNRCHAIVTPNCPISHNFSFVNSPDLGQTWNAVHESLISPCCAINLSDKPWIAVTPDGLTVYITFNDRGVPKFVVSFDGGQSFSSAQKMTWPGMTGREGGGGYFFAEGMGVTSSGRVCTRFIFRIRKSYSETLTISFSFYSQSATTQIGTTNMWVICSDDSGASWAGGRFLTLSFSLSLSFSLTYPKM